VEQPLRARQERKGDGRLRVVDVSLHEQNGAEIAAAICGTPPWLWIHYESVFQGGAERSVNVAFALHNSFGGYLTCFGNIQAGAARMPVYAAGYFEC